MERYNIVLWILYGSSIQSANDKTGESHPRGSLVRQCRQTHKCNTVWTRERIKSNQSEQHNSKQVDSTISFKSNATIRWHPIDHQYRSCQQMTRPNSHIREEAQYVQGGQRTNAAPFSFGQGTGNQAKGRGREPRSETNPKPDRTFHFTNRSMLTAYLDESREN